MYKAMTMVMAAGLMAGSAMGVGVVTSQPFGKTPDGVDVSIFTLTNSAGCEARIINYGGIVVSFKVPDQHGRMGDVVLGYDNLNDYIRASPYFGCLVGRCGNRIAKGKFMLDGSSYTLATNNIGNHLHGGIKGFDKVVWQARTLETPEGAALELTYVSKDGEEGYPGTMTVKAVYALTADNGLRLDFTATTDAPTICNLTHHSYFNLAGKGEVLDHVVRIPASCFTPVDETLIPTGQLRAVEGTPFDFRQATAIGARINEKDQQLKFGRGYDHNWVIDKPAGALGLLAEVREATSGRIMQVWSTEPGVQFYTGNFLDGTMVGKQGLVYQFRTGFCLEPQHYPDSPNHPAFPSVVLRPGETYRSTIVYSFPVSRNSP